jgi:hypothetical protein
MTGEDVAQLVEPLLSKYKALSSNSKKGRKKGRKEGRKRNYCMMYFLHACIF